MSDLATTGELATVPGDAGILSIINAAVVNKMDPASLERLFALYERVQAAAAVGAFHAAMAAFKAACPQVQRRTPNSQFPTVDRNGRKTERMYASLEDIGAVVKGPLGAHSLSYRWGSAVLDTAAKTVTIACIVSHAAGHSVEATSTIPYESKAGCSDAQKMGTAEAYAMRYSLVKVLGLTSCDEDTDGNAEVGPSITDAEALKIEAALGDMGADIVRFCEHMKVARIVDISAANHNAAWAAINSKRDGEKRKAAAAKAGGP